MRLLKEKGNFLTKRRNFKKFLLSRNEFLETAPSRLLNHALIRAFDQWISTVLLVR